MTSLITGRYLVSHDFERREARKNTFGEKSETLKGNFADIHEKQIGDEMPEMGYPDDGNGRYF